MSGDPGLNPAAPAFPEPNTTGTSAATVSASALAASIAVNATSQAFQQRPGL